MRCLFLAATILEPIRKDSAARFRFSWHLVHSAVTRDHRALEKSE